MSFEALCIIYHKNLSIHLETHDHTASFSTQYNLLGWIQIHVKSQVKMNCLQLEEFLRPIETILELPWNLYSFFYVAFYVSLRPYSQTLKTLVTLQNIKHFPNTNFDDFDFSPKI